MRLDRSERVRSDRRADGPGHGSSSISPTLTSPLRSVAWRPPPFGSAGTRIRPRQLGSGSYSSRRAFGSTLRSERPRHPTGGLNAGLRCRHATEAVRFEL
jgi:hypothetical protein